jgi:uncharacterized membrane protein
MSAVQKLYILILIPFLLYLVDQPTTDMGYVTIVTVLEIIQCEEVLQTSDLCSFKNMY